MTRATKARILIVEDEERMALCFQRDLEGLGYEISGVVATGEEAIFLVQTNHPDLVLMDVTLSGDIDGIQAAQKIRSMSHIPIVYVTGRIDIEQWEKAKITDPFGYIIKPCFPRELDVVIAAALYKSRKERELSSLVNRCECHLDIFKSIIIRSDADFNPFSIQGPIEKMMGYEAKEIIAGNPRLEELIHPDDQPLYSPEDHENLRLRSDFSVIKECRILTRDNKTRWVRKIVRNISDKNGKPFLIESVISDINDHKIAQAYLKETHQQLLQSEKLASIGQLTAGVAHEINNPLAYIASNMEVLKQRVTGYKTFLGMVGRLKASIEEGNIENMRLIILEMSRFEKEIDFDYVVADVDKLLKNTQGGIDKIQKIVMDLRLYARQDSNVIGMEDLETVLEGVLNIALSEIRYKAELKKEYTKIPMVKCNAHEMGQVFLNILINAAQAIQNKGEIKIKTYTTPTHVCVAISDTGSGIPKENMRKIFTPFFTTKGEGKGTGLGLSISYEIVKKHNGDVLVESHPDQGTTFTVLLPR